MSASLRFVRLEAAHFSEVDSEVDMWSARMDAPAHEMEPDVERMHGLLCEQECRRAAEYRCARSRTSFVVGRAMLRLALSEHLTIDPRELRFREGKNGKLELRRPMGCAVQFSLTHADDLTLVALTCSSRVGIDVERVRPVPEADQIVERFASSGERAAWRALSPESQQHAFFRWWTSKEAYLKATGEGLSGRLDAFDVPLAPGDGVRRRSVGALERHTDHSSWWWLTELAPAPGYLATIAVERP